MRPEFVRRKAGLIVDDLDRLSRFRETTYEALVGDDIHLAAVERLLERVVMRAVDVNEHLLATLGPAGGAASVRLTYRETFLRLVGLGVLPDDVARRIAPSAGLRNILVHDYTDADRVLVHAAIQSCLSDDAAYVECVLAFVDAHEEGA